MNLNSIPTLYGPMTVSFLDCLTAESSDDDLFFKADEVEDQIVQRLSDLAIFASHFRENAGRALRPSESRVAEPHFGHCVVAQLLFWPLPLDFGIFQLFSKRIVNVFRIDLTSRG